MATTTNAFELNLSAIHSGVAKNDAIGLNGDYTFTVQDLLANDAGSAAKNGTFFFGTSQEDRDNQAEYLSVHGITDNGDGSYTIESNAVADFQYSVSAGKGGTWSIADVAVTVPEADSFDFSNVTTTETQSSMTDFDLFMTTQPEADTGYNTADAGLSFDMVDVGMPVDAFQHSDFLV